MSGDSGRKKKTGKNIQQSSSGDRMHEVNEGAKNLSIRTQVHHQTEESQLPDKPWRGLYHGDVIKSMISVTLRKWSQHEATKIYIVTPFIDGEGLRMIKKAIGSHEIEALYTRDPCHYKNSLKHEMEPEGNLKKEDVKNLRVAYSNEEPKRFFHCKLVAAAFPDHVEILMTSANLHQYHFTREQVDSVHVYQEKPKEFEENYLNKLDGHTYEYNCSLLCNRCGRTCKASDVLSTHEEACKWKPSPATH